MKHLTFVLLVLISVVSCTTTKIHSNAKTHIWKGVPVTQKEYDFKLDSMIHDYVKNSSESDLKLLSELKVVYDTTTNKK